jgi:hypothetical protein
MFTEGNWASSECLSSLSAANNFCTSKVVFTVRTLCSRGFVAQGESSGMGECFSAFPSVIVSAFSS